MPLFSYHNPIGLDSTRDELSDGGSFTTDYSVRPEFNLKAGSGDKPLSEGLVKLSTYANAAILSENLYMRYFQEGMQEPFHEIGNTTGYGDGSVQFIRTNEIPYWQKLYVDNGDPFYRTTCQCEYCRGRPQNGIWYQLDVNY